MKAMEGRGETPTLPPIAHKHLVSWWLEIGPTSPGAMGDAPLSVRQIADDMEVLGVTLDPWEARAIRRMSSAFVSQRHDARKPGCPAPYSEVPQEARDKVSDQFAAMMGVFGKRTAA